MILADRAQAFLAHPWEKWPIKKADRHHMAPGFTKLRMRLRSARRFLLTNEMLEAAVRLASTTPETILKRAALAYAPFDDVWIEWDQEVRCRIQEALGTSDWLDDHDRGWAGYLICRDTAGNARPADRWYATPFISGRGEDAEAEMGPLNQCLLPIQTQGKAEVPDEIHQAVISGWGYKVTDTAEGERLFGELLTVGGTPPELNTLLPNMTRPEFRWMWKAYKDNAHQARGDLRFLITVLSMINCAPVRYTHSEVRGRFSRRLHSMDYLDHHTVTIHADSVRIAHLLEREADHEAAKRKRHEVRGHWALAEYRTGRPPCRHIPAPGLRDGNHCICERCGRLIVWKEHHERGDASLGWVQHDYEVTR